MPRNAARGVAVALLAATVPLTSPAFAADDAPAEAAATYSVYAYNYGWYPSWAVISPGDTIWFEAIEGLHNWNGCPLPCPVRFYDPGYYDYVCTRHPYAMTGTVEVDRYPSVRIDSPSAGADLAGFVTVSGVASHDARSIVKVEVRVDAGAWMEASRSSTSTYVTWSLPLDTTQYPNGERTISARAYNSRGLSAETSVKADFTTAPEVVVHAPASGATVTGDVVVNGTASFAYQDIAKVEVRVGTGPWSLAALDGTGRAVNWTWTLRSGDHADGDRAVTARATTVKAQTDEDAVVVRFLNGPTLRVDSHADGAAVDGLVAFFGNVTSPTRDTQKVEWRVDGGAFAPARLGEGTDVRPWDFALDTTRLANGPHALELRATATAGGTTWTQTLAFAVDVQNPVRHDLRAVGLRSSYSATTSDLRVTLANDGNVPSPPVEVLLEFHHGGTWRTIAVLDWATQPPFSLETRVHTWDPDGVGAGRFPVRVSVDPSDALPESNEANNAFQGTGGFVLAFEPGVYVEPTAPPTPDPAPEAAPPRLLGGERLVLQADADDHDRPLPGATRDASGHGRHADLGLPFLRGTPVLVDGAHGKAYRLGPTRTWIGVPESATDGLAAGTLALWLRMDALEAGKGHVWAKGEPGGADAMSLVVGTDGRLEFRTGPGSTPLRSASALLVGQWAHVAVTWGPDGKRVFVNGVLDAADADPTGVGAASTTTLIGADPDATGSTGLRGAVDEVRVYGRALPASDVGRLLGSPYA